MTKYYTVLVHSTSTVSVSAVLRAAQVRNTNKYFACKYCYFVSKMVKGI